MKIEPRKSNNSPLQTGQHCPGTLMGFLHSFKHVGVTSETIPSYGKKMENEKNLKCL